MKRFHFNLETLGRVYARDEEEKKKRLAEANRVQLLAEEELKRLGAEYDGYQSRETGMREKGVSVLHLRLYTQYLFDLKNRIERQKRTLIDAHRLVKAARDKLIEARRKVKALENIREKRLSAWKKERSTFEAKQLDDICQQMVLRRTPEATAA